MKRVFSALTVLLIVAVGLSLAQSQPASEFEFQTVEVIRELPHDTGAYTQGLLLHEGSFYESAGLRGVSNLREVDPETGEVLRSVPLNRDQSELSGDTPPPDYFAEGLTLVDDRLIQITWTAGEAFVYDIESFDVVETFTYEGEGWGICYDDRWLYMSDGSQYLSIRDPQTFELVVDMAVTFQGRIVNSFTTPDGELLGRINELECVGDYIYANSYLTDYILKINKTNGELVALIDASGLLAPEEGAELQSGEVLNGIAYDPESETFYITGKHWPKMYEVQFVPSEPPSN